MFYDCYVDVHAYSSPTYNINSDCTIPMIYHGPIRNLQGLKMFWNLSTCKQITCKQLTEMPQLCTSSSTSMLMLLHSGTTSPITQHFSIIMAILFGINHIITTIEVDDADSIGVEDSHTQGKLNMSAWQPCIQLTWYPLLLQPSWCWAMARIRAWPSSHQMRAMPWNVLIDKTLWYSRCDKKFRPMYP